MKNNNIIIPIIGLSLVLAACNFNELNFPGYNADVAPTNIFSYEDSLVAADYVKISKILVDSNFVELNSADSAASKFISTNKYFTDEFPAFKYIPLWLAQKYLYGDRKSSVMVTSSQYISEEGELQDVHQKYILDSVWYFYAAEILNETFASSLGKFSVVSVVGDQKWVWNSTYACGYINGFSSGNHDNEDWLISPALNFSKHLKIDFSFDHAHNFGDSTQVSAWVTDMYVSGNPDSTQWKRLNIQYSPWSRIGKFVFRTSGIIPLDEYAGKPNVHIALRYMSTIKGGPQWEVRNFQVLEREEE